MTPKDKEPPDSNKNDEEHIHWNLCGKQQEEIIQKTWKNSAGRGEEWKLQRESSSSMNQKSELLDSLSDSCCKLSAIHLIAHSFSITFSSNELCGWTDSMEAFYTASLKLKLKPLIKLTRASVAWSAGQFAATYAHKGTEFHCLELFHNLSN